MTRAAVALLAALALSAAAPSAGAAARFAVGVRAGASVDAVASRLAGMPGVTVSRGHDPLRAVVVSTDREPRTFAALRGVAWVERLRTRRLSFTASDPLAARQWYLGHINAFDYWTALPPLPPVRVAVIDSGVDVGHPDLEGRIVSARSFVGGRPNDRHGHGTFVAGIIAAGVNNGHGIAGIGLNAELLVAKVVKADGTVPVEAEAAAIKWAADAGARVINLSLGGLRDPLNPGRDTYSHLEAAAVRYAQSKGALVVAAVGNATEAPKQPWHFANYPAALAHVVGVSALERDGDVPLFSSRDRIHNDVAAPGSDIFSMLPRGVTALRRGCANQGYADCGPEEFRRARGTSFAAPQVSAAAALLFGQFPALAASQVGWLLTRAADDASPGSGCPSCDVGRDAMSGWGRLDVAEALAGAKAPRIPPADVLEPNDDAGSSAATLWGRRSRVVTATADYWDDQSDVYRVYLRPGHTLRAGVRGPRGLALVLWRPGTERVDALTITTDRLPVSQSARSGSSARLSYRTRGREHGWFFLQVKLTEPGAGRYTLTFWKRPARS